MTKQELIDENVLLKSNIALRDKIEAGSKNRIFTCVDCGGIFVLNDGQYRRRLNKGNTFYCSAGHGNVFTETT